MKYKKKILFLLIVMNIYSFANSFTLQLGINLMDVKTVYGLPESISVIKKAQKEEWNLICYHYDCLDVFSYKGQQIVNGLYIYNEKYLVKIDDFYIHCGIHKNEIIKIFGSGFFEGEDERHELNYYYSLKDFIELNCFYDKNDILCGIFLSYANPD